MDVIVKVRDPEENLEEKIKAYKVKKRIKTAVTILAFVFALISSYLLVKLPCIQSKRGNKSASGWDIPKLLVGDEHIRLDGSFYQYGF